jgi:Lrp/AsnC family transcriptional regulator for asnA, asnC and gidA
VYFQGARLNTVDPVLDNRLLELLTHDGRQSAAVLASQLGVKAASVRRRIKQLISEGTIRIIAVSSLSKVGAGIMAIIGVRTSPGKAAVVGEHLANQGNPRFVATTSGGFDVMVWGRFQSLDEMAYFTEHDLNQLDGVMSSETFVCLRVVRGDMVQL